MTRFSCQTSKTCAVTRSSISLLKSTPMISAPKAGDKARVRKADDVGFASKAGEVWAIAFAPCRLPCIIRTETLPIHIFRSGPVQHKFPQLRRIMLVASDADCSQIRADAEIALGNIARLQQLSALAGYRHAAIFDDVAAVGDGKAEPRVLLGQQDRHAPIAQA